MLQRFSYKFDAGPLDVSALGSQFATGNCRRAVQYYYFEAHGYVIKPEQSLCPALFDEVGEFVVRDNHQLSNEAFFSKLLPADLVFAERIVNANGLPILRKYADANDRIIRLHSAVFLGSGKSIPLGLLPDDRSLNRDSEYIWHSSAAAKGTAVWTTQQFAEYYQPVAAKRLKLDD